MDIKQITKFIVPIICCMIANSVSDKCFRFGFTYDGEMGSRNDTAKANNSKVYTYSDAIDAISKSDMLSCHKQAGISDVKQEKASEAYKAITSVASSDMLSYSKMIAIKKIMEE